MVEWNGSKQIKMTSLLAKTTSTTTTPETFWGKKGFLLGEIWSNKRGSFPIERIKMSPNNWLIVIILLLWDKWTMLYKTQMNCQPFFLGWNCSTLTFITNMPLSENVIKGNLFNSDKYYPPQNNFVCRVQTLNMLPFVKFPTHMELGKADMTLSYKLDGRYKTPSQKESIIK